MPGVSIVEVEADSSAVRGVQNVVVDRFGRSVTVTRMLERLRIGDPVRIQSRKGGWRAPVVVAIDIIGEPDIAHALPGNLGVAYHLAAVCANHQRQQ